ncbi:transporter substrate-binding domain-containing protein [Pelagibacterium flavum]|uniref:Transporter substrate-binding domain-containing protein n=1 Tax=Pelagibacterium flavum TaxID=2984530 RepID=A0ABY6IQQ0_9HYPH|nr:transporter substrate-binding domain-containing protein [Pelagibacterium sp. YIM 151497]UYQ71632.1 transporter substrate-binding domain-containing protein [Pelagibacterium sp. YIM 151497]|tara:strand:+ start:4148 stop:4969 length:822 start_codon:yes stop_codon:yes gene_type:complete
MMPAFRAVLFAACILFGGAGCAVAQNLPVHVDPGARDDMIDPIAVPALRFLTTPDFPPFNYADAAGRLAGFNVDLADAICARLEARCTIQAWPWNRVQDALADNQGDALIAGLDIDGSAAERFDFSRIYLQLPARFVTQKPVAPGFDPLSLTGTVAVREGSAHAELAQRTLGRAEIVFYGSEFEALDAVAAGEADAFFGDAARASFWLNENPDCCGFAGEAYFRPDLFGAGLAVAVPAGLDNVRVAINWALTRLQREGRIDEIYLRWFPVSFY